MMTINNKTERSDGGKCFGWPVASYVPEVTNLVLNFVYSTDHFQEC